MILDLGKLVSVNVFIFHFLLHFYLPLCIPSPKFEIKTFSYTSQHFTMACLFLEILHLSDLSTVPPYLLPFQEFLSPVANGGQSWKLAEKQDLSVNFGFITYYSPCVLQLGFLICKMMTLIFI